MKTLTNKQIIEAARAAVEERGADYIYPRSYAGGGIGICLYAEPDGTPSCIVGDIINRLSPEDFIKITDAEKKQGSFGVDLFGDYSGLSLTELQMYFLDLAQGEQDAGKPWGYALTKIEALENSDDAIGEGEGA